MFTPFSRNIFPIEMNGRYFVEKLNLNHHEKNSPIDPHVTQRSTDQLQQI